MKYEACDIFRSASFIIVKHYYDFFTWYCVKVYIAVSESKVDWLVCEFKILGLVLYCVEN